MKYLMAFLGVMIFVSGLCQKKNNRNGQPKKDTLRAAMHVVAQNYGDSIVVRWAPGNGTLWLLAQKNGYLLRRSVFSKKGKSNFLLVDSSSRLIRPWTLTEWADYFKASHDSLSAIAAQVSYGKTMSFDNGKKGNSFNTINEKYNEQQNRFGFAMMMADFDPAVANGLGFRFVERQPKKDLYYLYSVIPAPGNKSVKTDTGRTFVEPDNRYQRANFPDVIAIPGDKLIKLHWTSEEALNGFSAYLIEKSEDGKNFSRINRLPFVSFAKKGNTGRPIEFSDSVVRDYKNYYYRVTGIDAFGDRSYPSKTVIVQALDLTPPHYPIITSVKANPSNGNIQLQWMKKEKESDFKGYVVGRSTSLHGPFQPITKDFLPFGTTSFTDDHPETGAPNYYMVAAVDTAGNAGRSMPGYMNVEDHQAPAQPVGLTGQIDSNGIVTVHWNWGKEKDLAGYKIFYANSPDHVFTPLNSNLWPDSLFKDSITLKTLTKKIYYKVIAYDRSMNPSRASAILALTKPDKIAPVAAIIKSFLVTDSGVNIQWVRSSSADAATQIVYRRQDTSSAWMLWSRISNHDSSFTDRQVQSGHVYQYAVETLDSSGLSSAKSFPLKVYVYANAQAYRIKNFQLSISTNNTVSIKWGAPPGDVNFYILFKGKQGEGLKMTGDISGAESAYSEKVTPGNYQYAIKAVYKNGTASPMSDVKTIQVQ